VHARAAREKEIHLAFLARGRKQKVFGTPVPKDVSFSASWLRSARECVLLTCDERDSDSWLHFAPRLCSRLISDGGGLSARIEREQCICA